MAHRCNFYCDGDVHCVEALMHPAMSAAEVLEWLQRQIPLDEPLATVLRVHPAPEADVAAWTAQVEWVRHPPEPEHTQPWLAFCHFPDWPVAPRGTADGPRSQPS